MKRAVVRLSGGQKRQYPRGTPLLEIAKQSGRVDAMVARVDSHLVDLRASVRDDSEVEFLSFDDPEGKEVFWHSSAHLLAQAVKEIFPQARLAIGPPIDDGFYYDIDLGRSLTQDDLDRIETKMRELAGRDQPIERVEIPRDEAERAYKEADEIYKLELLREIPGDRISFYKQDGFKDMCRGPHIPSTGRIKAIELLSTSAAYWRGDEHRPMLQRIYGISFPDEAMLNAYLERLEEAKRRDHRRLGRELELFTFADEVGQGLPLWLPRGATVRRILERYIVDIETAEGYLHVYTPDLANSQLYKISGHWDHFRESMYPSMEIDNEELVLKPMNCPHHIMIYKYVQRSYRDLPIRIAELGRMYRYERSGTLTGLHRVRSMTLNDAHIFCRPDQIKQEFTSVVRLIQLVYEDLGIRDFRYDLSLHDPNDQAKFFPDQELWQRAEQSIKAVLDDLSIPYRPVVGAAAFYGPKLDAQVLTATGKEETLSTVQLDFLLPQRFELEYFGEDGKAHAPVMIHRAIVSTMERMMAFLIEYYVGAFPLWLAPEQVRVLPIADRHISYAHEIAGRLRKVGLRVEVDGSNERIAYKIRRGQILKVPYMFVVGDKEVREKKVSVRHGSQGDLGPTELEIFIAQTTDEAKVPVQQG